MLATHNRGGEIIYEHVSGFTYRIKIITFTKQSAQADRSSLHIRWGDEAPNTEDDELDSLFRVVEIFNVGNDVKKNVYEGLHSYSGPGTFVISVEDPNRNAGVLNINNGDPGDSQADKTSTSVMSIFAIRSTLVIRSGNDGHNNSIQFLKDPIQDACTYQPWIHNPVAYDSLEGDQLVFALVPCLGALAQPLADWESPVDYTDDPNDIFQIDPENGDITWDTPLVPGEYNVAFEVREYRNGLFVGSVQRDMQITVVACGNRPPEIQPLPAFCVAANETLTFTLSYSDPDLPPDPVTVDAEGGPMSEVENIAEYNVFSREFSWTPRCDEVRLQPYYVSFFATDNASFPLTDVETVSITVVCPPVENPTAQATGNNISLTWDATPCLNAIPPGDLDEVKYLVYRRNGLSGFVAGQCELGVPEYTGYSFIGSSQGALNTSFQDPSVLYGGVYCYMIVTVWPDGALSYASEEFCDTVRKDAPVITKVSVGITDLENGSDTIMWSKPSDLDTLLFPGPYFYRLLYIPNNSQQVIFESDLFDYLDQGDSIFIHNGLNTYASSHQYQIEIHNTSQGKIASSSIGESVFLELDPGDNQAGVTLNSQVPWTNYKFIIYRKDPGNSQFAVIDTSDSNYYLDTGLINNALYCYRARVLGTYNSDDVPDPLENWSQESCVIPYDLNPPCPPQVSEEHDCATGKLELRWQKDSSGCAEDAGIYRVYYGRTDTSALLLVYEGDLETDSVWQFIDPEFEGSIAGCYAVSYLDSLNLWPDGIFRRNESPLSDKICVDNCPVYFLPNIFTPNGDGLNDALVPLENRHVASIRLKMMNRWGSTVFESSDPAINWRGIGLGGEICPDGVYYYTIEVDTLRLSGIVTERFTGTVQLLDGSIQSGGQ
jgi:gliding motility-associated-like protein